MNYKELSHFVCQYFMQAFLLLTLCAINTAVLAQTPVRLVTSVAPDHVAAPAAHHFIHDLFSRIDTPYTLEYRPSLRAELEFKQGKFDGDVARISTFNQSYPGAIRVDPPMLSVKLYAFSHTLDIKQASDLHQRNVAYIRGTKMVETPFGPLATLHPSNTSQACIKMVIARRVDACLIGSGTISQDEIKQAQTTLKANIVAQYDTYFWLAPTQQQLAQRVSHALQQMQKDGSLERHQQAILQAHATVSPAPH